MFFLKFPASSKIEVSTSEFLSNLINCAECNCGMYYFTFRIVKYRVIAQTLIKSFRQIYREDCLYFIKAERYGLDIVICQSRGIFTKYARGFNKCKMIPKFRNES